MSTSNKLSPEKSGWGWKLLIVAVVLGSLFLWLIYLAVSNDADYMPSQQKKHMQHMNHSMQEMDKQSENPQHAH